MDALPLLEPVSAEYASLPVADAFNWHEAAAELVHGEWYLVAFRSIRRASADEIRLTEFDERAHLEAAGASGFIHYFKGPAGPDGTCLSFCLWQTRADARAAAGRPDHVRAVSLIDEMYESYTLEFHRVTRQDGGALTFEPYDRVPPVAIAEVEVDVPGLVIDGPALPLAEPARDLVLSGPSGGTQAVADPTPNAARRPSPRARAGRLAPGLAAAIAVAVVARLVAGFLPAVVSEVTIAILIGLAVGRLPAVRSVVFRPGLKVAAERCLRLGIVLLGAKLSAQQIAGIGLPAAAIIALTMAAALVVVLLLSRLAAVDGRLAVLLAVGAAVCGNSAVVATSPVIGARPRDTAYAVATVTLFGTLAVFAYPLIGHAAGFSDAIFGLWAGIAINDTSQVVAASSAYSAGAFEVATVVKLIRNALMAPLLLGIAWTWHRRTGQSGDTRAGLRRAVPLFVLGFLALSALRSVGAIDAALATTLETVARALILVALAAVGLNVRIEDLRAVGPKPLLVGLGGALIIGVATILAITSFGLADGLVAGR